MNFIGHAYVARCERRDPLFVLGSMLPDFVGMARTRLVHGRDDVSELGRGIALHHRTDDVFHGARAFTSLVQTTLDELCAAGVGRGSARAVAHIGAEMLLDGELLREQGLADGYLEALQAGEAVAAPFLDPEGRERWRALRTRLLTFGAPHDYRDPEAVLLRLELVLRGRPRLAIADDARETLRKALPGLQTRVVAALPALLQATVHGVRQHAR